MRQAHLAAAAGQAGVAIRHTREAFAIAQTLFSAHPRLQAFGENAYDVIAALARARRPVAGGPPPH
jgi:hypothetical protein